MLIEFSQPLPLGGSQKWCFWTHLCELYLLVETKSKKNVGVISQMDTWIFLCFFPTFLDPKIQVILGRGHKVKKFYKVKLKVKYMFSFFLQGKIKISGAPEFQRARRTEFPGAPGPARRRRLTTKKFLSNPFHTSERMAGCFWRNPRENMFFSPFERGRHHERSLKSKDIHTFL